LPTTAQPFTSLILQEYLAVNDRLLPPAFLDQLRAVIPQYVMRHAHRREGCEFRKAEPITPFKTFKTAF
jgi:hypothetical protein